MIRSIEKEYAALIKQKHSLNKELAMLPDGYISVKSIKGNTRYYLQKRDGAKIVGTYIRTVDLQKIAVGIERRKKIVSEIPHIDDRLSQLEQAAKLVSGDLLCHLMILKMCAGMDALDAAEKKKCVSFGVAMNAIEGVHVSDQTSSDINEWETGKRTFLSVFESTLKRYGFPTEA